ncbi:porin [Vibrio sp.]|uniref:Porin n=1 Tax=Vibrio viridaestus TaxID=2487322 RepID=A0A3N9TID7_9VIBR|nr:porin [Vibrio viridaestus]MDC0612387.1 porin [Vibrio sp.]RQW63850.1 porin [Vibrio viridaestus]
MKKTLIALAVAGAAVATGANASELYNQDGTSLTMGGRVVGALSLKDGEASDASYVRLSFLGKQEINEGLYGVGYFEGQFESSDQATTDEDDTSTFTDRYTYAGLGGTYGEVTYGKQDGSFTPLSDFTDIMTWHGDSSVNKIPMGDRTTNLLKYTGQFDDLYVNATYHFADRTEVTSNTGVETYDNNDQDGAAVSGIYTIGDSGVALGAGFGSQNENYQTIATASFTHDALYLAALYSHIDYDRTGATDYDGYELAAAYTIDKTKLIATYNYGETSDDAVNNLALEAAYYFQPNFRAFVSYNINMLDAGDTYSSESLATNPTSTTTTVSKADAEDEAVIGLRYDF